MAFRASANRYQNYELYSSGADYSRTSLQCNGSRELSPRPNLVARSSPSPPASEEDYLQQDAHRHSGPSSRLEYIVNAMAYIRGELDDLKESDRVLLEIFKQLESNVSELNDSISTWKVSGPSPGRPKSSTDLDFGMMRSSYCEHGLETILDTSKEDLYKASVESDSLYLPEHENSSNSCSPVLPSLKSHTSCASGVSSSFSKRSADISPQPQLRTSTSYTSRLASSPSITRLQDETGSNISRNSSIDSGIQFASEAENGSGNGVEPMQIPAPGPDTAETDVRKSVGFADDIFAALGMN